MSTVVISGADRNIGLEMCREFLRRGWTVYGGKYVGELTLMEQLQSEYPRQMEIVPLDCSSADSVCAAAERVREKAGSLDMLVHNAAGFGGRGASDIKGEFDFTSFESAFNINALGAIRLVQAFLPLMESGKKRLCFTSSEAGVVSVSHRTGISGYGMSKTALNMALRLMFNRLSPLGYSFRLYHPGWVRSPKIERDGQALERMHGGKFEPWETAQSAVPQFIEDRDWEDRMVLIDNEGAAWPF
ncbi:MAG: SDR family NAD(P)-dependent oxidoreductase [Clostridiales bacterium]|jgi:NAD(P)-dependent dehydrogenase (short-subunit alcohol dehydrogenase family)|nr:SDR family NAD(P)-dependent oxidoreductase [Clostridiales bacterium]